MRMVQPEQATVMTRRVGLVTLTDTLNPMGFLRDLLGRDTNVKTAIVFPVGYPIPSSGGTATRRASGRGGYADLAIQQGLILLGLWPQGREVEPERMTWDAEAQAAVR